MIVQISQHITDVEDRFFIDDEGNLYTDFGKRKMSDNSLRSGYIRNNLPLKKNSSQKSKSFSRHRLVMICFQPVEEYEQLQVNHIDGNKLNNRLENLEWCTNQENRIHACQNNLCARLKGEENPFHKLTEKEVLEIIDLLLQKVPFSQICSKFNISKSTVSSIKNHRNWSYLTKNIKF